MRDSPAPAFREPRLGALRHAGQHRAERALLGGAQRAEQFEFTMFFPEGTPEAVVAEQASVVRGELESVRTLCE
ncbi:hypothetical protein AMETH_1730 [Amycolatopsis methanolica 239]|uniref:Uncharacterized protein n=1 Tax=Amycolatopsis methanolica 239 TaxID=1068978 RepID=A0A076MVJ8_AMYME|nr:hypothetical protein AMETH_1730 [Amycolatopsis methanolica 239]